MFRDPKFIYKNMLELLPNAQKKSIKKEYFLRLFSRGALILIDGGNLIFSFTLAFLFSVVREEKFRQSRV